MPTNQKMARINIDDGAWTQLRMHALRVGKSVADLLGQMVRDALAATSNAAVAATPKPTAEPASSPADVARPKEKRLPSRGKSLPHDLGPDVPSDWSAYRDATPHTWIPPWEE